MSLRVVIVHACTRDGQGGSPTAVVDEQPLTEAQRRAIPVAAGTSHAVFIAAEEHGVLPLRFFTAAGELPACGHGTVAALAVLAERARATEYEAVLRTGSRTFHGQASGGENRYEAAFDPGPVELRASAIAEREIVLAALGIGPEGECRVASVGRPRMLVQVADREALAHLAPNMPRLREACDRLGLLGCYVHSAPTPDGRLAARMFAPSIGVPEDIANANSTACLAAHLADHGFSALEVDMGDSLGEPATITTSTQTGPEGPSVWVGGAATIAGHVWVDRARSKSGHLGGTALTPVDRGRCIL